MGRTILRMVLPKNAIVPATYAADFSEFSRRMKAQDPAIQVGANGDTDAWWQTVLTQAAAHIDFLSVHSCPCWKWTGYEQYRTDAPDILGIVRTAANAIDAYAPSHQHRLKIMLTEFAAGTFGPWDNTPADLGRALITFDLQGQLLQSPQVYFSQFWNTHNIYSELDGGVFDALLRDNMLSPLGRALWIWNHFLGDEMVAATSSAYVRCFASRKADQQLAVFLLNKDPSAHEATVALQHLPREFTQGERWVFHGNGPADQHPRWERVGPVAVANSRMTLPLEPASVTVILLKPPGGSGSTVSPSREVVALDCDWRFHRGDIPATLAEDAGGGDALPTASPVSPAYDDSAWRKIDVPHDCIIEGTFDAKADTLHGSLPVEPAWYRKTIAIPACAQGRRPWMAGGFAWAGFDYRGEPTPFGWPCISSQFGILDTCGFPKDAFCYYQSWWSDRPVLHILPHWNWPGKEGQEIDVWVYSNCPKVELFLNDESLGAHLMKPNSHLEWKVKYAPGRLVARGVYDGKMVTAQVETTGAPAALALEPGRKTITAEGRGLSLVTVRVVDDQGRTVPVACNEIVFTVTGAGRLLGVGNGDPSCHESDKGARRSAFNGLCLALVPASPVPGVIALQADSSGLRSATAFVDAR